ncbi:M36 family metallopeptidase [Marinibactrum halimedae]|uniref:FTP domain-containing protein n=1 Tax=Marinibactrum halimedae TaxID=1444977 RepID=A0AA37T7S0_9GAMM|nr:M36 family metallopeptidase [Marinibactrum halimedae]MCD9460187.1 M36 family metallopeptidase [Marinibactrum halimedae]GLS26342.1 hypothetical protein GCM10007877_20570 [Marinibactrum halimedae]
MKGKKRGVLDGALFSLKKLSVVVSAVMMVSPSVFSLEHSHPHSKDIDKRLTVSPLIADKKPSSLQHQRINQLKSEMPELVAQFDEFGATSSLMNATGTLTQEGKNVAAQPLNTIAEDFVFNNLDLLGLNVADVNQMLITDKVKSPNGVTHIYYQQVHHGIPVYNGQLQVHLTESGAISHVNNRFIPDLANMANTITPSLSASQAIMAAAKALDVSMTADLRSVSDGSVSDGSVSNGVVDASATSFTQSELSSRPIKAKLMFMPVSPVEVTLVWNFQFELEDQWPDITVDATSGEVITSLDTISYANYRVFGYPTANPALATPAAPADGRVMVVDPEDPVASPDGWFNDGGVSMEGNNVRACSDTRSRSGGARNCDPQQPVCDNGTCDFPLDLSRGAETYIDAAIANLFYWTNLVHDVQHQYGFDEASGNFQNNNFGRGGRGSDAILANAQDGSATCNARFYSAPDGSSPTIEMYRCDDASPTRDSDMDNEVIVHEYGHGISIRLVGGPSNTGCLRNAQQGGEGWSDWFGLVYTPRGGEASTDSTRGMGAYFVGREPLTGTIRQQPYSLDPIINTMTYESIDGARRPHGVGAVWAQVLWEMYWSLVDKHGYEDDLMNFDLNDPSEAGNKRAMFYVTEGLKNTSCSPTFVDARDGIITAATNSFDGEDVCAVWQTFADFGIGTDARSGGSSSTRPTNGFELPEQCQIDPPPPPPPSDCSVEESFESGAGGWTNSSASSCSTGDFVVGTPSRQTNGGVVTQVGGAAQGSNAYFTATNTSAGSNDVDGGNCIANSPTYSVTEDSTLSLSYFHGQRDSGDDEDGDFFRLEMSTDGGNTYTSLASNGDSESNAAWTTVSTAISANSNVTLRVQCSDGAGPGDLVECGVDNIRFCAQ